MMGQQQQTVAQKEAGAPLRRMVVALTMAAVVVAVMALSAGPAQARLNAPRAVDTDKTVLSGGEGGQGGGFGIGAIRDESAETQRTSGGGGGQDAADRGGGTTFGDLEQIQGQHGSNPPELPN